LLEYAVKIMDFALAESQEIAEDCFEETKREVAILRLCANHQYISLYAYYAFIMVSII